MDFSSMALILARYFLRTFLISSSIRWYSCSTSSFSFSSPFSTGMALVIWASRDNAMPFSLGFGALILKVSLEMLDSFMFSLVGRQPFFYHTLQSKLECRIIVPVLQPAFKHYLVQSTCFTSRAGEGLAMNSCFLMSLAEGRLFQSKVRHLETKLLNQGDHFQGSERDLGGWAWMEKMARQGCWCEYGGTPSASSRAVMPSDQMSVLKLQLELESSSGLIHRGLPVRVWRWDCETRVETPKSATFTSPLSSTRMLAALMSRWIMFLSCKQARASRICPIMVLMCPQEKVSLALAMMSAREPREQQSITIHTISSMISTLWHLTICGWLQDISILISLSMLTRESESESEEMILMAQCFCWAEEQALQIWPQEPLPMSSCSQRVPQGAMLTQRLIYNKKSRPFLNSQ